LSYRRLLRRPIIAWLGLLRFLPTCYWGMMTVLVPLLMNRMASTKTSIALYATVSQLLASIAQALAGEAADRWGSRWPTFLSFGGVVVSGFGLALFPSELWSFYLFGVLGTGAAWSLSTLMAVLVSDATVAEERGRVLGALNFLWNVAMMLGALGGGALLEVATALPFLASALLNLGSIVAAVHFFRLLDTMRSGEQRGGA
jgi:MFS family permease